MLNVKVSDSSGSIYVSFPREIGEPIMNGVTAEKFKQMKEEHTPEEFREFLNSCTFNVIFLLNNL